MRSPDFNVASRGVLKSSELGYVVKEEGKKVKSQLSSLTTWEDFALLPDADNGNHYELHDGEVVSVPPPRPVHVLIQSLLVQWLTEAAQGRGRAAQEFPDRPAANLQFWHADVAYIPNEDWEAMRGDEYPVYAPLLVVEVLSPSNRSMDVDRQRVAAFSAGSREFWVVDPDSRTIEVSMPGLPSRFYGRDETVPVSVLEDAMLPVRVFSGRVSIKGPIHGRRT